MSTRALTRHMRYVLWVWGGTCFVVTLLGLLVLSAFMSIDGHSGPAVPFFILAAIVVWAAGLGLLYVAGHVWCRLRQAPGARD